jgi:GT2 family glycosyltransferase
MSAVARVTAVIVTHHSGQVIGACLESLAGLGRIIVVDNASADDTREIVGRVAPAAEVIHNTVGVGYGNGANQGLDQVTTEFALLANPDSVMRPGALEALVAAADRYPGAALLAPAIINSAGEIELSHDVSLFVRGNYGKRDGEAPPEGDCSAAYLSGAVNLVRMSALRGVGFFDPRLFLYYDDDDMCLRLSQAGHGLVLAPSAVAEHRGGGSVRPSAGYRWEKFWHMAWSRLYMEEKYRGAPAMRRLAWSALSRYALKALAHGVTLNRAKAWRDAARACGSATYLLGRRIG